jgi:hypothetical protein
MIGLQYISDNSLTGHTMNRPLSPAETVIQERANAAADLEHDEREKLGESPSHDEMQPWLDAKAAKAEADENFDAMLRNRPE